MKLGLLGILFSTLLFLGFAYSCSSVESAPDSATLAEAQEIPVPKLTSRTVIEDFNKDGKLDLALVAKREFLRVYTNTEYKFDKYDDYVTSPLNISLCSADFNNDGNMDLLPLTEANVGPFFLGSGGGGDGKFTNTNISLPFNGFGKFIHTADLNNDSLPDFIATGDGLIAVYLNKGDLNFDIKEFYISQFMAKFISADDIDGNGFKDIIAPNYLYRNLMIIWNNGAGSFSDPIIAYASETGAGTMSAAVSIKYNDKPEPVIALAIESEAKLVMLEYSKSEKVFTVINTIEVPRYPVFLNKADMNSDGLDDIIVTHLSPDKGLFTVLYGPSFTETSPITYKHINKQPMSATIGDWSADGYPDIFVPDYNDEVLIYIPSPSAK
ncbi:Na-Ca exchanger/integrin-beta4 [Candidatus Magnetoovum chiemensis]|nr:Na-Ca exchanger/integrin-beta4 [Candidatus Magnetoovum chiemensis]